MSPRTIFISAYRNVSIRYLLYSGILDGLKRGGSRIVIFVKDGDVDHYRRQFQDDGVWVEPVLFEAALRETRDGHAAVFANLVRKCLSGRTADLRNTTDDVRLYQYGRGRTGLAWIEFQLVRALVLVASRSRALRHGLRRLESRLVPGRRYDAYFHKYDPSMFVASSVGYMIDPLFMRAARRHGCTVVSIPHSWDNPSSKGYRGADPDHVITWNEIMKREIEVFHDVPADRIQVGGVAHWDYYFDPDRPVRPRAELLIALGLDPDRRTLFYPTSSFRLFMTSLDVCEHLLKTIGEGKFARPSQLIVRFHPSYLLREKDGNRQVVDRFATRISDLERRFKGLVAFTTPAMDVLNDDLDMPNEDMHELADTILASDLVLTEYSSVMIEASILDVPIVNVSIGAFRDTDQPSSFLERYTHIRRIQQYRACRNAYDLNQLNSHINDYLIDRSLDRERRKALVDAEMTTNRGCAAAAIAAQLLQIHDAG